MPKRQLKNRKTMNGWRMLRTQFMDVLVLVVVIALVICSRGNDDGEGRRTIGSLIPGIQDELKLNAVFSRKLEGEDHHLKDERFHHKELFPLDISDKLGLLLASLGLIIAAGGGIGGGGMLVPIYALVMKFHTKTAIPLSNVTVLGGAMANFLFNVGRRHPIADRPQVDWDLILMMEPLTIGGALIGTLVNKVVPEEYLTVLMVFLLGFIATRTISRGIKEYIAETKEMHLSKCHGAGSTTSIHTDQYNEYGSSSDIDNIDDEISPLLECHVSIVEMLECSSPSKWAEDDHKSTRNCPSTGNCIKGELKHERVKKMKRSNQETERKLPKLILSRILEEERRTPWEKVGFLLIVFVIVLVMNILKGGGSTKSIIGIRNGSFAFWFTNFLALVWLVAVTIWYGKYLLNRWALKEKVGYRYVKGDVEWDSVAIVKYPFICGFAGFSAGLFGVGGGIVKGPLMLEMGVLPLVASSTSATMILFTSFTAATSYVTYGLLPYGYGLALLVVGFIFTFIGQVVVYYVVRKFNRPSMIILSIGVAVAISAVMMGGKGLLYYVIRGPPISDGLS